MRQYLDLMHRARHSPTRINRPFKEVETVRLFTATGHPWIAFAALLVWRLPLGALTLAAIVYAKHGL